MFKFDQKEIPQHARPILSNKLVIGETYFHVSYADQNMTIPIVESLVYVGKDLGDDKVSTLYFQDVESYLAGVRITDENADPDSARFESWPEDSFHAVFEFEHALEELMKCSLRRTKY